jgi:hypothetical protein
MGTLGSNGRNGIKRKQQNLVQHSGGGKIIHGNHDGDVSKSMNMNPFKNPEDIANRNIVNRSFQYDSHNNSIQN